MTDQGKKVKDKYQGFETLRFVGVFSSDGDPDPLVLGLSKSGALEALIVKTAEGDGVELDQAQASVDAHFDNGDYFLAPVALRGAFQNDGHALTATPNQNWIDEAFSDD